MQTANNGERAITHPVANRCRHNKNSPPHRIDVMGCSRQSKPGDISDSGGFSLQEK